MDEGDFWDDDPFDGDPEPGEPNFACDNCCDTGHRNGVRCRWCNPTPRQVRRLPLVLRYEERHAAAVERRHARAYARGRAREPQWLPF